MATPSSTADVKKAIADYLWSKHVPPTAAWLANFMSSIRPSTPIAALQQTALFRILSTDLTTSIQPQPSCVWPTDVSNSQTQERALVQPMIVQVLEIEDIGRSRWSQVETLEAQERGEMTKGREVIRVIPDESNEPAQRNQTGPLTTSSGPHKLLLQDAAGTKCYAFDVSPIPSVNIRQIPIGAKLVLRNITVARGVALLDAKNVEVLGGKVEEWDKKWKTEQKDMLKRKAEMGNVAG